MSRTQGHGTNGQPVTAPGRDWWGKRPLNGHPVGKRNSFWKRVVHKIERREAQDEITEQLENSDEA